MLTHRNIFANVVQSETVHYRSYIRGEARYLIVIPYFHIYAFTVGMMQGTWVGALQILIPKYDVEQVLTAIRTYRPTYFPAVPTIFVSLLAHPKRARVRPGAGAPLQFRRRAVSGGRHRRVRTADRPDVERGLRPVRDVTGDAFDAAARPQEARHDRPARAGHRHQGRRCRNRDA
jgi:acyl-CoA synthetase (AMP-forming)/AMP-acid ligase II